MKKRIYINTEDLFNDIERHFVHPPTNKVFWILIVLVIVNIIVSLFTGLILLEVFALMMMYALIMSRQESYMKSRKAQEEMLEEIGLGDYMIYDIELTNESVVYTNCEDGIENVVRYEDITHYRESEDYLVIFNKEWQYLAFPVEYEQLNELKTHLKTAKKINWLFYW